MSLRAVLAQTRAELILTLRRGESLLVTFAIPLGVLVFFSKADGVASDLRARGYPEAVDFLVPGVLALAVISTAMVSLGIATGYERRYAVLKRLGSTPLTRSGLLVAKTLNVLVIEIVQIVMIVGTGLALGWSVSARLIPVVLALMVGTIAFAGIGMLMAGTLRAEANLALSNGLFLVLLGFGGVFYSLDRLPSAVNDLARALPSGALTETVRTLSRAHHGFPLGPSLVLLAWAIAMPIAASRWFRWEE